MERRRCARLNVVLDVRYTVLAEKILPQVRVKTSNISMGGLRITTHQLLKIGTNLNLEIYLTEGDEPIIVKGYVVWQNKASNKDYETGIRIENLKDSDKKRFSDFVFHQMYQRVGLPNWPGFTKYTKERKQLWIQR